MTELSFWGLLSLLTIRFSNFLMQWTLKYNKICPCKGLPFKTNLQLYIFIHRETNLYCEQICKLLYGKDLVSIKLTLVLFTERETILWLSME